MCIIIDCINILILYNSELFLYSNYQHDSLQSLNFLKIIFLNIWTNIDKCAYCKNINHIYEWYSIQYIEKLFNYDNNTEEIKEIKINLPLDESTSESWYFFYVGFSEINIRNLLKIEKILNFNDNSKIKNKLIDDANIIDKLLKNNTDTLIQIFDLQNLKKTYFINVQSSYKKI